MYLIAIAWIYVVLIVAAAQAASPQGTVLGALVTLIFYGVLPLALVLYVVGTPLRRRARRAAASATGAPDDGGVAAGDAVATKREEP